MAEDRVQRKLVAILAADIVGFSRLMEADEVGTFDRLKTLRREIFAPTTARFGGRIFKLTGDGALAEFSSAADALQCAVVIQTEFAERNFGFPERQQIALRVGLSLGDVIVAGDDLYGNGVNVAARMEGLADPGGICISNNVYEHVSHSPDFEFHDLGEQTVKNIGRPVRCYRVQWKRSGNSDVGGQRAGSAPALSDKPSIAVLPFDNLSNDPEQEYFSDGLAEDLITDISNISGLFVTARNSSFAFKGQAIDVKEIAKKLGVKHIVEGSVRKMGNKLRVNAQLIDAASGGHVWAARYDGDMEDIFQFQDDIREQIVSALKVSLTPTDKALTERKPTDSVEAYDFFLKGRANFNAFGPDHLIEAIKCFERAVEIDPNFADAYGYLSLCHFAGWGNMLPDFDNSLERAHEMAERGVALDGSSAIAVTSLGWTQTYLRRYDQAIANFERALALTSDNANSYSLFGQALNWWGDPERGRALLERAFDLEPFGPPNREFQLAHSHLLLRQYDQAITRLNRAVERIPKLYVPYAFLAWAYAELDRPDEARDTIKKVLELAPRFSVKQVIEKWPYRIDEDRNRVLDALRKAGLPEG